MKISDSALTFAGENEIEVNTNKNVSNKHNNFFDFFIFFILSLLFDFILTYWYLWGNYGLKNYVLYYLKDG